ncbi:hypothetical protein DYB37_004539 [Aphanomyces astaci]|uniref:Peptidase S26 domain-containing protein n=1 Tax=Aphanomyces astaci TaxID=112090 RepID=A0A3R6YI22_APHAT|nr:hypothetical protein DYB35_004816 [Aphanomyces astaci]RHZ31681.1 hypothetical protein DYB37_004539 [Aphanomyces astaci]
MEKWAIGTVRVLTAAICVKVYVGDVFLGMGPSMEPTLPDRVIFLVEKLSLRWRPATVGDVVVVSSPTRANGSMCKRIIAMVQTKCIRRTTTNNEQILRDNATASVDSRHYGPIPAALILGRASYKVPSIVTAKSLNRPVLALAIVGIRPTR